MAECRIGSGMTIENTQPLERHLFQRRAGSFQTPAVSPRSARDVVAIMRYGIAVLGDLDLEDVEVLVREGHFRAREIKLPHAEKNRSS